jgi:hypothetical protein
MDQTNISIVDVWIRHGNKKTPCAGKKPRRDTERKNAAPGFCPARREGLRMRCISFLFSVV